MSQSCATSKEEGSDLVTATWTRGTDQLTGQYVLGPLAPEIQWQVATIREWGHQVSLAADVASPIDQADLDQRIQGRTFPVTRIDVFAQLHPGDDRLLSAISRLPFLDHVIVHGDAITNEGIRSLARSTGVRSLVVYSKSLTNASLWSFLRIPRLRQLDIQGSPQISPLRARVMLFHIREKWLP